MQKNKKKFPKRVTGVSVTATHALAGGVWWQVLGAFCQPEIEEVEECPPK